MKGAEPLLSVEGLSVAFTLAGEARRAVDSVSFGLQGGRTLALLGESGSGKSVTALAMLSLLEPPAQVVAGRIMFKGEELSTAAPARIRELRGNRLAMVFQEPMSALNPVMRVGEQVAEPLRVHCGASRSHAREKVLALLSEVGLPNPKQTAAAYPHQLSGGMRQRVMIAMALACGPDVLIADEPTTALDVTTQAQILSLLRKLQRDHHMALLFITHDLSLLGGIADHVAVMYAGRIVERREMKRFVDQPAHPYTDALKRSLPGSSPDQRLAVIPGQVPALGEVLAGCAFAPRCPRAQGRCFDQRPELTSDVACFYPLGGEC